MKLLTLLCCSLLVIPLYAGYIVDTNLDTADANIGDGICDDGTGSCSLRAAIQEGNVTPGTCIIMFNVAPGNPTVYTLTSNLPSITGDIVISGTVPDEIIIDGSMMFSAFSITGGSTTQIVGLTIQNTDGAISSAVNSVSGSITIENCRINNARSSAFGGAISNAINSSMQIQSTIITNCTTTSTVGGGGIGSSGILFIDGTTISDCNAPVRGGAIYNNDSFLDIT
ncbi:MAG: hypothetical protein AAF738_11740, partial [Bacteroidota bacterium]